MAQVKFTNNGKTTLNGAINSSVTSIVVTDGSVLPSLSGGDWFYLTIENNALAREIVKVTARTTNTLTVVRGQDGTAGAAWLSGDKAENRLTLAALNEMAAAVSGITPGAAFLTLIDDVLTSDLRTSLGLGALSTVTPGTGVATALAIAVGSAGAFVTFNGALGTPSSGVLTNATGLPISTGVSGLGTGAATFLATPTSANLAALLTDETGTGAIVFAASPTLSGTIGGALTFSGAIVFSSTATFSNYIDSVSASPEYRFNETDAPTDEKHWRFIAAAGDFYLQALNEAYGVATVPMRINRTGTVIDSIAFATTALTHNGSTIWTLGNDGAGSGLDADLLDGKNTGTSGNTIPLLDGNNTWSGSNTWTSTGFIISNTFPNIQMYDSDGALNQKYWRLYNDGGSFVLDMINDAFTVGNAVMAFARTAHTSATATFSNLSSFSVTATSINMNGQLTVTGTAEPLHLNRTTAPQYTLRMDDNGTIRGYIGVGSGYPFIVSGSGAATAFYVTEGGGGWFGGEIIATGQATVTGTLPQLKFIETDQGTDLKKYGHYVSGSAYVFQMINDSESIGTTVYVVSGRSTYLTANFDFSSSVTLTKASNTIWHAGNDGAGSGLDADLLDGYNTATTATANTIALRSAAGDLTNRYTYSDYSNSTDDTTSTTISYMMAKFGDNFHRSADAPKVRTFLAGQCAAAAVGFTAWNTEFQATGSSQRRWSGDTSGSTNGPGGAWWFCDNMRHSNNTSYWGVQIAWGWEDNANKLKTRNVTSGSFGSWVSYWNDSNDGAGSGLDADLLDGLNSATGATVSTIVARDGSGDIYAVASYATNWFRSTGDSGWYSQTWGGGIYMTDGSYVRVYNSKALYVANAILATGDITAYYSDERLKTRTGPITNALEKVCSLDGFTYVENELAKSFGYSNTEEQVGLSAQQVKAVLPQIIKRAPFDEGVLPEDGTKYSKSGEEYMTLDYARVVPLLVEAIKELTAQVRELQHDHAV